MDNKPQDVSFFGHPRGLATLFHGNVGKIQLLWNARHPFVLHVLLGRRRRTWI